ncbi:ATP-binding protein [Novosphingobium mangrovi (ex Hu et al. 2023)]|uniref:histidine kinase n=1 Tax=Novosphingobium mangrovi (ex Hu et al. 2023) TaxID=2930094 RepID=A0ABT0AD63_9SPHN|nr:ATP-binding protein [Novosphingobium mangrovi (ex Hu et al. 2023)]MCJ1961137.1 ATP-binding protein [Novosphingobium mangrovi (ex Hu et al. 2023)]
MKALLPRSLMGQMLLAVAVALLFVQSLSAFLVYSAQRDSYETGMLNVAAFRIVMETRGRDALRGAERPERAPFGGPRPRGFPLETTSSAPNTASEVRDGHAETKLGQILGEQSLKVERIVIVHRRLGDDKRASERFLAHARHHGMAREQMDEILGNHLIVVGVQLEGQDDWLVTRVLSPRAMNLLLSPLIFQTLGIYAVLMAAVTFILRRMTRPLAALTRRVEDFAVARDLDGQIPVSGPEDMQRLILAHNAMETRIVDLLDEKDVMLGAIGHDLKTPLAALRVRIESVEDDIERARMATTIEDIVRTLDDILSLARVGRPSDPLERTELSALVVSVVEEYEDMGEPVELGETCRMALELRPTWLRRALRNLIGNALRYGHTARVSLGKDGGQAVIVIEDDGPGIPDNSIESMMNPFTRGDPSRNSATGGAGLGLALARAIADQHGGSLTLANRHSAEGRVEGLTARLTIPLG